MAGNHVRTMLGTVVAGLGRLSVPAREPTDLRTGTLSDVWCNARRGVTVLGEHGPCRPALSG